MARKIEIPIGVDTGGVQKSIQNGLIEPLEDAEDALEKLGGSDAGADLAKDLNKPKKALDELGDTKAGKDIERDLEKAQGATKDLSGELESTRKDLDKLGYAAKDAGDSAKDGMRRAEEGVQDFKQEANSTAKEAAASFDGSAESIGEVFQEVAANAFGGFGPAGAVAGLAAAAGIGLAIAGFEAADKAADLSAENIDGWAEAFIQSGAKVVDAAIVMEKYQDIMLDTEKYKEAEEVAGRWGVSTATAALALAGSQPSIDASKASLDKLWEATDKQVAADGGWTAATSAARFEQIAATEAMSKLTGELGAGAERADTFTQGMLDLASTTTGTTEEVDELGNKIITFPTGAQVVIDADTGQATNNVDTFKGNADEIGRTPYVATVRTVIDDSAVRNYRPPTIYIPGRIVPNGEKQVY